MEAKNVLHQKLSRLECSGKLSERDEMTGLGKSIDDG